MEALICALDHVLPSQVRESGTLALTTRSEEGAGEATETAARPRRKADFRLNIILKIKYVYKLYSRRVSGGLMGLDMEDLNDVQKGSGAETLRGFL